MGINHLTNTQTFIRPANLGDLAIVQELGYETYADHFSSLWSSDGLKNFLAKDFSAEVLERTLACPKHHQWLIAFDSNEIPVGLSKTNWARPNPISYSIGAELQKIYLLKSSVGSGIGEMLLNTIIRRARENGEPTIWLEVLKSNIKAQNFYARFGFNKIGEIPFKTDLK